MSWEGYMLNEISGVKCRKKLLDLRIGRIVKMKIEIPSNKKSMWSIVAASERKVYRSVRKSEKGTGLRVFVVAGGGR